MNSTDYTNWVKETYPYFTDLIKKVGLGKK